MDALWLRRLLGSGAEGARDNGAADGANAHPLEHAHRIDVPLHHLVNTSEATKLLMRHFGCDDWYVACRQEHLVVIKLTRKGVPQYGVSYRCTPEVEKAVFHGSKTWAVSVIPLHSEDELTGGEIAQIKAVLEQASTAEQLSPALPSGSYGGNNL